MTKICRAKDCVRKMRFLFFLSLFFVVISRPVAGTTINIEKKLISNVSVQGKGNYGNRTKVLPLNDGKINNLLVEMI